MDVEKYFSKALRCQKDDQIDLAITLYQEILAKHPDHLATLYNLATLLGEQHDYAKAKQYYEALIRLEPDFVRGHYNLAICYLQEKNPEKARVLLEQAVTLVPEYAQAHHMLGGILVKQGELECAAEHFEQAIAHESELAQAYCHLGMVRLQQGHMDIAQEHLENALTLEPAQAEGHYHLGLIHLKKGDLDKAEMFFQGAHDRDENHFAALYNLGLLKKRQGFHQLAEAYFKQASHINPNHEALKFLRASLNPENTIEKPPEHFVEELFDRYAHYYDAQMQEGVHYQVPQQLLALFEAQAPEHRHGAILDLGCGTGLTGRLFKPYADSLIGVDLSSQMLAQADRLDIYSQLIHADIVSALKQLPDASQQLCLAADVFGYIGKLDAVFEAVSRVLRPGGLFLFSIEPGDKAYQLGIHTRFKHAPFEIERLATRYGFQVLEARTDMLREHEGNALEGVYYALNRSNFQN